MTNHDIMRMHAVHVVMHDIHLGRHMKWVTALTIEAGSADCHTVVAVIYPSSDQMSPCAGPLPASWGSEGALPALSQLVLPSMHLSGSLPPDWFRPGAF